MYGNEEIKTLLHHYGRDLPTKTIASEQFTMPATITSDLSTEWTRFEHFSKNLHDHSSRNFICGVILLSNGTNKSPLGRGKSFKPNEDAIESPESLQDEQLEQILDIQYGTKKPRRICV